MKYFFLSIVITLLFTSCLAYEEGLPQEIDFLTGTWKAEGMEEYEVWVQESETVYSGYAYRIKDGKKQVWEKMRVSKEITGWQLVVDVPDQNEGKAVIFKLTSDPKVEWLFVNEEHDFPKRILYKKLDEDKWLADVRGDDNKGFSYHILRQ